MAFSVNRNLKKNPSIDKLFNNKLPDNNAPINNQLKDIVNDPLNDNLNDNLNDPIIESNHFDNSDETHIMPNNESFIHNNKSFFYLNDNFLSKTFGDFMNIDKQYNIKTCIYKINSDCDFPFLQFLFDKSGEKITFPNIDFHCPPPSSPPPTPTISATGGNNDESNNMLSQLDQLPQEHTFFMNQCSQELLKVLPIHDIFSEDILQKIYKGFIEHDNILYVVFDSTTINDSEIDENKYSWAIIDEMVNSRKIIDKEFDPIIVDLFFKKSPYMMDILDDSGIRIVKPNLLYMCNKLTPDATLYTNVTESVNKDSINIIDEPIDHPFLGSYYYFTSNPIAETDLTRIKRYAVFNFNCRYILTDINTIQEKERTEFIENLDDTDTNLSIYFKEDGIQLWCIKTNEQFTDI